ncbi:MAG: glycosyltransferase family 2 protein [Clostridiales bacterium]|nr:glycosyltransferase family 2 protein [Candidatus Crickella caballi]
MLYSIVIPCYNSAHTITRVIEETSEEMQRLGRTPFEFVLADDCSPDGGETLRVLKSLADRYDNIKIVELARNGGQHNATMAALNYCSGDVIISMDDDGQTHCSQLPKLFDTFDNGYDLVFGYYEDKKHSAFRNFGSWVNYETVRVLIGKPKSMKTSSFWITRKYVRDYLVQYTSPFTHLQGLFLRTVSHDRIASVPVKHFDRAYGKSNYTLKKLLSLWSNIMGFSTVPLKLAQRVGVFFSAVGINGAIVVFIHKLVSPSVAVGWSSMMVALFFFSGLTIFFLGLIGEYIGRMMQNINNTPQFVVKEIYTGKDSESE